MTSSDIYVEQNPKILSAISLANQGNFNGSIKQLEDLQNQFPDNHFIRLNLAQIYLLSNQFASAEKAIDEYLTSGSMIYFDFYTQVVSILTKLALFSKALKCAKEMTGIYSDKLQAWWLLVETAHEARAFDVAIDAAEHFIKLAPQVAEMKVFLGNMLSAKGAFTKAEALYHQVLDQVPTHSVALYGLSRCRNYKKSANSFLQRTDLALNSIPDSNRENAESKARIWLAEAKVYNDQQDFDKAWLSASKGKQILQQLYPFNQNKYTDTLNQLVEIFLDENYQKPKKDDISPILIVGMPRSGTTLIEQLLSLDTEIYPAGEKQGIEYAFASHFGRGDIIEQLTKATAQDYKQLALRYTHYYQQFSNYSGTRIVDKVPRNYLYLPIFKKMFPNIKILNLVRNKLDNASSIYFEHFSETSNYTNSVTDILHVRNEYQRIMSIWQHPLSKDILNLEYEKLVEDFPFWREKIIEFCNLNIDASQDYTQSNNRVETPSVWQVRQGIFSSSIGRWKRYRKYLEKFESI